MATKNKKIIEAWIGHEWQHNFEWQEHPAKGFRHLILPDTRENKVGFANTKVRITIEETCVAERPSG
jgi:hypothetical protein